MKLIVVIRFKLIHHCI